MALREHPDHNINLIAATRSWTRRVTAFLRKAGEEPEILRTMRSLLHHTFELRNDIRQGHHIAPRLPPSAEVIWPVIDGTEKEDQADKTIATP
jgi:hypothetical protein